VDITLITAISQAGGAVVAVAIISGLFLLRRGKMDTALALRKLELDEETAQLKHEAEVREEERKWRQEITATYKDELKVCQEQRDLLRAENDRLRQKSDKPVVDSSTVPDTTSAADIPAPPPPRALPAPESEPAS
jgi:hypothetical protein